MIVVIEEILQDILRRSARSLKADTHSAQEPTVRASGTESLVTQGQLKSRLSTLGISGL
ncbi:hypothetical protein [uncultured Thermosynechococcus sp.]|uniref:hypothetical protein n=1 Tax=uncultured Thermosynechococcus sp. TaxID=436945 RepID=UPI0026026193|nr:hypothetical protein [uncultured Thermosynechococcus sp.]